MSNLKSFFSFDRILLLVAAVLLYGNTLTNGYSVDDGYVTQKDNFTAQGFKAIPQLLTSFYGVGKNGLQYDYRPLVKISYAIEHQFFGVHPGVSHFFNLVLYILCLFLVYRFVTLLVLPAKNKIPLYAALLFAFLPIHTEVVASLKNRDILLCFIFSLQACIIVMKAQAENKTAIGRYVLALVCFVFAFLSKLDAVPFLFILPAIVFLKYRPSWGKIAFYVGLVFAAVLVERMIQRVAIDVQAQVRPHFYFENPLFIQHELSLKIVAFFNSLGFYLVQCTMPFKQSCYYGADTIPVHRMDAYGFIGVATLIVLVWLFITGWRKKDNRLLTGLVIFMASISMYLNLATPLVGIVADRFTFFASLGFCVAVIFVLHKFFTLDKKLKPSVRNVALLLFLVYGYMIVSRNAEWKNAEGLIEADLKKYPSSAYLNFLAASNNITVAERKNMPVSRMEKQQRVLAAKKELQSSVAVAQDYPGSLQLLSHILIFYEKDFSGALPYINQALRLRQSSELLFYKGLCLQGLKNDSSEYYFKETIRADSAAYNAYRILAETYNARGEYDKTLDLLNAAVQKGLRNELIYSGLATTYFLKKDTVKAKAYCQKVLEINPNNQRAQEILAQLK